MTYTELFQELFFETLEQHLLLGVFPNITTRARSRNFATSAPAFYTIIHRRLSYEHKHDAFQKFSPLCTLPWLIYRAHSQARATDLLLWVARQGPT